MPCYHPVKGFRKVGGGITFGRRDAFIDLPDIQVACGQCIGCRLEKSRQWAIRCMHEAQLHEHNCFLTLTYDDQHLPRSINLDTGEFGTGEYASLNKRDITLFFKNLRKALDKEGIKIRYYQCGEYGSKTNRPHHHVILFGFNFPDRIKFTTKMGFRLYTSKFLRELWPHGNHLIGEVSFESAAYVARYCLKKYTNRDDNLVNAHYYGRLPEYTTMSRRPGIASDWFDQYHSEVYSLDRIVVKGQEVRPPKYYDYLFDIRQDSDILHRIKLNRKMKHINGDDTQERLAVREQCKLIASKKLVRCIEE